MSIREDFEKAQEEKFPGDNFGNIDAFTSWAARWMAEKIASEHELKFYDSSAMRPSMHRKIAQDFANDVRRLAKELE